MESDTQPTTPDPEPEMPAPKMSETLVVWRYPDGTVSDPVPLSQWPAYEREHNL
jgi:hypothetical protein